MAIILAVFRSEVYVRYDVYVKEEPRHYPVGLDYHYNILLQPYYLVLIKIELKGKKIKFLLIYS